MGRTGQAVIDIKAYNLTYLYVRTCLPSIAVVEGCFHQTSLLLYVPMFDFGPAPTALELLTPHNVAGLVAWAYMAPIWRNSGLLTSKTFQLRRQKIA